LFFFFSDGAAYLTPTFFLHVWLMVICTSMLSSLLCWFSFLVSINCRCFKCRQFNQMTKRKRNNCSSIDDKYLYDNSYTQDRRRPKTLKNACCNFSL
jgi:hypothetical protein